MYARGAREEIWSNGDERRGIDKSCLSSSKAFEINGVSRRKAVAINSDRQSRRGVTLAWLNARYVRLLSALSGHGYGVGTFQTGDISPTEADKIQSTVQNASHDHFPLVDHGARFGGGLHLPSGSVGQAPGTSPDSVQVTIRAHKDIFNPRSGDLVGVVGHVGVDVLAGQITQRLFHRSLDKRCK